MYFNVDAFEYMQRQLGMFDAGYFKNIVDTIFSHRDDEEFEKEKVDEEIKSMLRHREKIGGRFDIESYNTALREILEQLAMNGIRALGNDTNNEAYDMNDEFYSYISWDIPIKMLQTSDMNESVVYAYVILLWIAVNYPVEHNEYVLKTAIDFSNVKSCFKVIEHIFLAEKLQREYEGFVDTFNRGILKSITPLDLSFIPAYIIETSPSIVFHEGKAYDKGDIIAAQKFKLKV